MRRKFHTNTIVLVAVLVWAMLIMGCYSTGTKPVGPYNSLIIASGIEGVPGTVSWSPDGIRLAFLKKGKVYLHDISPSSTKAVGLSNVQYIIWLDDQVIAALKKTGTDSVPALTLMNVHSWEKKDITLPAGTVAVYPTWDSGCLVALTSERKVLRIGIEDRYEMYCIAHDGAVAEKKYEVARIVQGGASGMGAFRGWMSGGVSLISGEVMLFRLINPPALPPYIRVVSLNVITGQTSEIARLRSEFPEVWGSWDPLGTRVSVPDDTHSLRIMSLDGDYNHIDSPVKGLYPAWDPRGGQIFFGGSLIREDGSISIALFPDEPESAAFFSPKGNRLAVAVNGTLWMFEDMEAAPGALELDMQEMLGKVSVLTELYREGFITEDDLSRRLGVLRRSAGGAE